VWLVRHARTAESLAHRLNGQPEVRIGLDAVGRGQCVRFRREPAVAAATVCVVSSFPRARETARRLLAARAVPVVIDAGLNELDYGTFEGGPFWDYGDWLTRRGPHARPPGSSESQREGLTRMTAALRRVLALPGRPLAIGHGLLVSVLAHTRVGGSAVDLMFPEASYLTPLAFTGTDLTALEQDLADDRSASGRRGTTGGLASVRGRPFRGTGPGPVGAVTATQPVRDGP
jgi:probable phosphoglycerate mutase